jgi:hypothetical protein
VRLLLSSGCVNGVNEGFKQFLRSAASEILSGPSIQFVSIDQNILSGIPLGMNALKKAISPFVLPSLPRGIRITVRKIIKFLITLPHYAGVNFSLIFSLNRGKLDDFT